LEVVGELVGLEVVGVKDGEVVGLTVGLNVVGETVGFE
jgi:hypothetical protein